MDGIFESVGVAVRYLFRGSVFSAVSILFAWVLLVGPVAADCSEGPEVDPWEYAGQAGKELTGAGVTIALLDSPVLEDHPAFQEGPGRVLNAPGQPDDVPKTPEEAGEVGPHGTAVASVAHRTAPGADIAVYSPKQDAYSLTGDPINLNPFSGYADAIDRAVDDGVDIFLYSGGLTGTDDILGNQFSEVEEAIKRAHQEGVLFITSAGNNGSDDISCGGGPDSEDGVVGGIPVGEPLFPVEMEEVFVVGGVQQEGSDGATPIWKPWDCSLEGLFVDAYAPSVDVAVAKLDGEVSAGSGTSFAAPVWAGYAAMLLEYQPDMPLGMLVEMMKGSLSSTEHFGEHTFQSYGVPDLTQLQKTIFEVENSMAAWGVIASGGNPAPDSSEPGWCFALPGDDGWMEEQFEVNLYRSNQSKLTVRGLMFQTSSNEPSNQGDPRPNFQFVVLTTPSGAAFEIPNPASSSLGCAVSIGLDYASQGRHIYDILSIPRSESPEGWCTYGAGSYELTADLGKAGTQTTTFEVTSEVLDVLCCGSTSSGASIAAGVETDATGAGADTNATEAEGGTNGTEAGGTTDAAEVGGDANAIEVGGDGTDEPSGSWPWIVGGMLGGAALLGALGTFLRRTGRT